MKQPNDFLLVDDDETNNILCGFAIRKAFGKEVAIQSFTNPLTALAYLREHAHPPRSILFLDINMPEISGWEFLDAFAGLDEAVRRNIIIYMMSSSLDVRDREKAAGIATVTGYVSKPLSVEKLKELFVEVVER